MDVAICTIGVYGHTAESFLGALRRHEVDGVIDVRQRRGVRGAAYAFANAQRLQVMLDESGIAYVHWKDAAPTPVMRDLQRRDDRVVGATKASRQQLSSAFSRAYTSEVLHELGADSLELVARFRRPAFLCVEAQSRSCHRSLVADWAAERLRRPVIHIEAP